MGSRQGQRYLRTIPYALTAYERGEDGVTISPPL